MGCLSSLIFNKYENIPSPSLNNDIIDQILSSTPDREKSSLEDLIKYFKSQSSNLTVQDKIFLVFKWISNNISFNCDDYINKLKNKEDMDILAQEEIYSEGKATSHEFSTLFITILTEIDQNIETKLIIGYIKDFRYKFGFEYQEPNHEWVGVKIYGTWYLVDPTLGAGYCIFSDKKLQFIKDFNSFYCFPKPNNFIRTNFPNEENNQFLSKKISINNFYNMPVYKSNFFKYGFKFVEPEEGILNIEKEGKIIINLQNDVDIKNIFLSGKMTYKVNNKSKKEENLILIEKRKNLFEVYFYINKNIEYKLTLFGVSLNNGIENSQEIVIFKIVKKINNYNINIDDKNNIDNQIKENIGKIKEEKINNEKNIKNNENIDDKITIEQKNKDNIIINKKIDDYNYFPTIFDKFIFSDIILIEPRDYYLTKGEKINFKIETTTYENNLFFLIEDENGDQMIELEKKENNIFEENSIYLHGNKAKLIYLNEDNYMDYLIEYKLIDNPNNNEKITYPKCYKKPIKSKLIEPLCDSIKKGEKINFKIEINNDNVEEVYILVGEKKTKLNQENNLFFNEVKIEVAGKENDVKIGYKEKDEDSIKMIYSYKIK